MTSNISNSANQTPKRGLEISPSEHPISPELKQTIKTPKMAGYADKNDIQEIKNLIQANTAKSDEQYAHLNNNLTMLRNEVAATKNELFNIMTRVQVLENATSGGNKKSEEMVAEINAVKQVLIETQISIHNIPENIETKHAVECLSNWCNIELNENNIKHSSVVSLKQKKSAILFLDFYDLATKHRLMKHVKQLQKDDNKKYIPILTDHVFKLETTNAARGVELNFREAMTDYTREIFNAARKEKDICTNVWISRGYVMVRIKDQKPTKIVSINHLNNIIQEHQRIR